MKAFGDVFVLINRAVASGSSGDSLAVDGDGVVDEEFDSYGGKAGKGGTAGTVLRRLVSQEEFGATDGEASDGVIEVSANGGAKGALVEGDGGFGIVDGEHGGDSRGHWRPQGG